MLGSGVCLCLGNYEVASQVEIKDHIAFAIVCVDYLFEFRGPVAALIAPNFEGQMVQSVQLHLLV